MASAKIEKPPGKEPAAKAPTSTQKTPASKNPPKKSGASTREPKKKVIQ